MTPEAQREAIALACGWNTVWKPSAPKVVGSTLVGKRSGHSDEWSVVPDYLNDLNAMHEAEKVLIVGKVIRGFSAEGLYRNALRTLREWHAPAGRRAEAILRTIGKWEDS